MKDQDDLAQFAPPVASEALVFVLTQAPLSNDAVKVLAQVLTPSVARCKPPVDPLRRRASPEQRGHQLVGVLQTEVIVA